MAATVKCEPRETNLVTASMMLVNNPVSENLASYYSDYAGAPSTSRVPSSTHEAYESYVYNQGYVSSAGPFSYGTYFPYSYTAEPGHMFAQRRNCACSPVPAQQSFLHQILVGKGYKNDRLCLPARPVIKQERDFGDYRCCYGYGYPVMNYGYPVYH